MDRKTNKYEKKELEFMTTFQLREICRKEKIMNGLIDPLDKEELIRTILKSMGKPEDALITKSCEGGIQRLEEFLSKISISTARREELECTSKIVVYRNLALKSYDEYTIPYCEELVETNAIIVGNENKICAVINLVEHNGRLYLEKSSELEAVEAEQRNYSLFCVNKRVSDVFYSVYYNRESVIPGHIEVVQIPLIDFEVREAVSITLPMAIDFGSVNTTAGLYLDTYYFEQIKTEAALKKWKENAINYTSFWDGEEESLLLPSVIGVQSIEEDGYHLCFGYEAIRLTTTSYIDEGFCVFYDIKRWISEYEKEEELVDRQGRRRRVKRSEILRQFFLYIIKETENKFKCQITQVHISSPVKQKYRFQKMFQEILPEYGVNKEEMLDEGMSVLYNTVSNMIVQKNIEENRTYEALIIDCGGGTTDLCSYRFRVKDHKIAYHTFMEMTYENGDTDFGGNNLTFRMMQLLKIALVHNYKKSAVDGIGAITRHMDTDIYRFIDKYGVREFYHFLDEQYEKAEAYIPTRFADFERYNRSDYYKVRNNFYTLFSVAENVKKNFYHRAGKLKILVTTDENKKGSKVVYLDKWKISYRQNDGLNVNKNIPDIELNIFEIEKILSGEIYGIIHKFMEEMYNTGKIQRFSFIKLTGQSCKIDLFKDALKEFVPGKMIQFRKRSRTDTVDYELKMTCVNGALKFMKDKRYGMADIQLVSGRAMLPYIVTAYTHNGKEQVLIDGFSDWNQAGTVSRNMEDLALQLCLKNMDGEVCHDFQYMCRLEEFEIKKYEEIQAVYGAHIQQKETDTIENGEVKFFVWANQEKWGYQLVPVFRKSDELYLGRKKFFRFESDSWVNSFYDGTK